MTPRPKTVTVRLTDLDVRAFSAAKVLLEFLHLRSFTARVGELDNRAGIQEVLGNGAEHTPPKLAALGTEGLLHPTNDTKPDIRGFWGSGSIGEGGARCLQAGRVRNQRATPGEDERIGVQVTLNWRE